MFEDGQLRVVSAEVLEEACVVVVGVLEGCDVDLGRGEPEVLGSGVLVVIGRRRRFLWRGLWRLLLLML